MSQPQAPVPEISYEFNPPTCEQGTSAPLFVGNIMIADESYKIAIEPLSTSEINIELYDDQRVSKANSGIIKRETLSIDIAEKSASMEVNFGKSKGTCLFSNYNYVDRMKIKKASGTINCELSKPASNTWKNTSPSTGTLSINNWNFTKTCTPEWYPYVVGIFWILLILQCLRCYTNKSDKEEDQKENKEEKSKSTKDNDDEENVKVKEVHHYFYVKDNNKTEISEELFGLLTNKQTDFHYRKLEEGEKK